MSDVSFFTAWFPSCSEHGDIIFETLPLDAGANEDGEIL